MTTRRKDQGVTTEGVAKGDVSFYFHDDGVGGTLGYRRVVRVNRKTVTVESPTGERYRKHPDSYNGKVKPGEWSPWNPGGM